MNGKLKSLWVKALRSGKYRQGEGDLYGDRKHCCLGVLARVQGAKIKNGILVLNGEDVRNGKQHKQELLAKQFAADLHKKTQLRLGNMNDGVGAYDGKKKTFKQIADFIEKNL